MWNKLIEQLSSKVSGRILLISLGAALIKILFPKDLGSTIVLMVTILGFVLPVQILTKFESRLMNLEIFHRLLYIGFSIETIAHLGILGPLCLGIIFCFLLVLPLTGANGTPYLLYIFALSSWSFLLFYYKLRNIVLLRDDIKLIPTGELEFVSSQDLIQFFSTKYGANLEILGKVYRLENKFLLIKSPTLSELRQVRKMHGWRAVFQAGWTHIKPFLTPAMMTAGLAGAYYRETEIYKRDYQNKELMMSTREKVLEANHVARVDTDMSQKLEEAESICKKKIVEIDDRNMGIRILRGELVVNEDYFKASTLLAQAKKGIDEQARQAAERAAERAAEQAHKAHMERSLYEAKLSEAKAYNSSFMSQVTGITRPYPEMPQYPNSVGEMVADSKRIVEKAANAEISKIMAPSVCVQSYWDMICQYIMKLV